MIEYLQLFFEFFKVGLFAIGGGLATLPFFHDIANRYDWFDQSMLADMVAVSQSTPGPMGINMATYAGYNVAGFMGSIVATFALVLPSFIIIIIVSRFLTKFKESKVVTSIFYVLRPAVTGLIAISLFDIINMSIITINSFDINKGIDIIINTKELILAIFIFILSTKTKKHPVLFILIGAVAGIILGI